MIEQMAAEQNIRIMWEKKEITHRDLIGSPGYVKRVMMNILSNAVKYNRENGQIYISCMEIPSEQPEMMTMEAITQGTAEHIMHHVMINFILNGEMRFMQFDFTREREDSKEPKVPLKERGL